MIHASGGVNFVLFDDYDRLRARHTYRMMRTAGLSRSDAQFIVRTLIYVGRKVTVVDRWSS